jgi:hypothetical protein
MVKMSTTRRTLGFFESCTAADPSCLVSMVAHLGGRLEHHAALASAVERSARRHPNLRSLLVQDDAELELSLCVVPGYEVRDHAHLEFRNARADAQGGWREIVHQECNTAFDLQGAIAYWKIVLIQDTDHDVLVVKFHHCIGDASSGYILINDILTFYQYYLLGNEATAAVEEEEALPVLPSVNDMAFPTGRTQAEEDAVDQLVVQLQERRRNWLPKLRFSHPTDKLPPPDGRIRPHKFLLRDGTKEDLSRLLKKCRQQGTTIGAVLAAATYFAVAKMHASLEQDGPKPPPEKSHDDDSFALDFDMDVNLRNRFATALGNDHVGGYIGMMAFQLSIQPSTRFWAFAAQVKKAMDDGLEEQQHFHYLEVNTRLEALENKAATLDQSKVTEIANGPLAELLKGKYGKDWKDLSANEVEAAVALGYDELSWNKHGHIQDMNFSNVGRYFFSPTVGGVTIEKIYCVGGGWCPTFGGYIFLIPAVTSLNFSLVYEASDLNDSVAKEFLTLAADLTETAWSLPDSFSLADYLKG